MGRKGVNRLLNANMLKAAMVRAGYTQQDLAKEIGISANTLTSKLKGERCFNLDEIDKVCDTLDIVENDEKCAIFLSSTSPNRDN